MVHLIDYPSSTKTWADALSILHPRHQAAPEDCDFCNSSAEVGGSFDEPIAAARFEEDGPMEVTESVLVHFRICRECAIHPTTPKKVRENIDSVWTGRTWDAWENLLDFPEEYLELTEV